MNSHWKKDVSTPITACSVEQTRPFKRRRCRSHHSWEHYQLFIANITQRQFLDIFSRDNKAVKG